MQLHMYFTYKHIYIDLLTCLRYIYIYGYYHTFRYTITVQTYMDL